MIEISATPRRTKRLLSLVGAAVLSLLLVAPTLAQSSTTVVVTGGQLKMDAPTAGNFTGVSITGEAQTTTASLTAFSVDDLRGTGAGWRVTARATQFATANASQKLDTGSLKMSAPTVSAQAQGNKSPLPVVTSGPYTIDGAQAVTIATAALQAGMGKYNFTATTLTLSLPANVYADTYTSTVTLTVAAGP